MCVDLGCGVARVVSTLEPTHRRSPRIVQGTGRQIQELQEAEDFRQSILEVIHIATNVNVTPCETGDATAKRMQRYGGTFKAMGT